MSACTAGGHLKFETALFLGRAFGHGDLVTIRVAGEDERQCAVTGHVAGRTEAVLKCEDGQHERGARAVKQQNAGDQAKRRHDRAARNAGRADGENAEQHAEQDHRADRRDLAIKNLRNGHDEEHLGQDRAAQMDIREQRDAEIDHVLAQNARLLRAAQRDGKRRRRGHRADRGDVCRSVVLDDLDGVLARVRARNRVQQQHPQVVADHDDDDDLDEYRELLGNGALIRQTAEGGGDEERQQRDDDLGNDSEHDVLDLVEQRLQALGFGPGDCETDHQRQRQCAHDVHKRRDFELEQHLRQLLQTVNLRYDGQVRNDGVAGGRGRERRADRRAVRQNERDHQHTRSVMAKLGDGRRDEADDDQRHAEGDDLAEYLLDGNDDIHDRLVRHKAEQNADHHAKQQLERQTFKNFPHNVYYSSFLLAVFPCGTQYMIPFLSFFVNTFRRLSPVFQQFLKNPAVFRLCPPRGSAHKIEPAQQVHKKSGHVPDFLYSEREKVSERELSDVRVLRRCAAVRTHLVGNAILF